MWTEAAISSQFLCRAEGGCEFLELPLVMPPSKVCPQCNAVVPIRLKVCRNRLKFALYNADRVNFKSRNYHVVAYNISTLAEGLHFSALVLLVLQHLSEIMITPHIRVFTIKQIVIIFTDLAQNSYWMVRQNQSM